MQYKKPLRNLGQQAVMITGKKFRISSILFQY